VICGGGTYRQSAKSKQQVPPLRYASVGMTLLLGIGMLVLKTEVSSRPKRSVVEGPAVCFREERGAAHWNLYNHRNL
jgi:hypothetical protein